MRRIRHSHWPLTLALVTMVALTGHALAQDGDGPPGPEANGDWQYNIGYVQGNRSKDPQMVPGYRWLVVAPSINAFRQPDAKSKIVTRFNKGTRLLRPPFSGGSDEGLHNMKDATGNYWMPVLLTNGKTCYVRANNRYITPLKPVAMKANKR